jgi:hypothetical protein
VTSAFPNPLDLGEDKGGAGEKADLVVMPL